MVADYWQRMFTPQLSHQCDDCHIMTTGPHKGENPGFKTHFIDESGRAQSRSEQEMLGVPDNVSHGKCPECAARQMEQYRMSRGRIRESEAWLETQRAEFRELQAQAAARSRQVERETSERIASLQEPDEPDEQPEKPETV